jgi:sulfur-oxidizing protein SoxX
MNGSRRPRKKSSAEHCGALTAAAVLAAAIAGGVVGARAEEALRPYTVVGDAIPESLTGAKGNAERGRAIVVNRQVGLCLLCHKGPFPEQKFQGTLAPDLTGTGARWSEGQLRMRMVDASRLNPNTIMPPYYRLEALNRVAPAFQGKPILTAEQIEDVVAYLATLRDEHKP